MARVMRTEFTNGFIENSIFLRSVENSNFGALKLTGETFSEADFLWKWSKYNPENITTRKNISKLDVWIRL